MSDFDNLDLRILDVLQSKGRQSSAAISDEVGLSETACYNRLKRIEGSGAIEHFGARLNLKRILNHQMFFTSVWLDVDRPSDLQEFEQAVGRIPEIVDCYYITGSVDYLLTCVTRDFDSYVAIMNSLRSENSNIKRWETSTLVRQVKAGIVPLQKLGREGK
jgi:Lrp/AsnC family transcriptional regulator of ectoine degradation